MDSGVDLNLAESCRSDGSLKRDSWSACTRNALTDGPALFKLDFANSGLNQVQNAVPAGFFASSDAPQLHNNSAGKGRNTSV
jgi:hypothetical protein